MAIVKAWRVGGGGEPVLIDDAAFVPMEEYIERPRECPFADGTSGDELKPLDFPMPVYNALKYFPLDKLLSMTDKELLAIEGFGKVKLAQFNARIMELGLKRPREAQRLETVASKMEEQVKSLRARAASIREDYD